MQHPRNLENPYCSSRSRGNNRWKKAELVQAAIAANVPSPKKLTVDQLCLVLGIQIHSPEPKSTRALKASKSPKARKSPKVRKARKSPKEMSPSAKLKKDIKEAAKMMGKIKYPAASFPYHKYY